MTLSNAPLSEAMLRDTSHQNPRALHIVLNNVVGDSRVLKCAWSLGNAGWDVIVTGATAVTHSDEISIGYAAIMRLPLKVVVSQALAAKLLRRAKRYKVRMEARLLPNRNPGIPNLARALKVITPVAMEFKPDIVHAHDYTALPIAGQIVSDLRKAGVDAKLVYDAHEYVPGVSHLKAPLARVYSKTERKYTELASEVLSVSEGMSELLIPHLKLGDRRPELIANDPLVEGQLPSQRNLRSDCGSVRTFLSWSTPVPLHLNAASQLRWSHCALCLSFTLHLLPIQRMPALKIL